MIESGWERVTLSPSRGVRWWAFLSLPGERLRRQGPRRNVIDRGFHFARGGWADTPEQALDLIATASEEARVELELWRHQPSHALDPAGNLIPLDEDAPLVLENPRWR